MTHPPRVRFAPSPTGNVHIGNIRTAIFNWLFARHEGGQFLLRIEDTDQVRSTPEAIASLLGVMAWLGLEVDEEPVYQSRRLAEHTAAVDKLLANGAAYRHGKGGTDEAILLRIPLNASTLPFVVPDAETSADLHVETPVTVDVSGLAYALVSAKGKAMPQAGALGGFPHLRIFNGSGACIFELDKELSTIVEGGAVHTLEGAVRMTWQRYLVVYDDLIKGRLAKPLDSLRDFVIVRSDGSPVFHLANVCDDIAQGITHIIRGDDHVENTYRHLFLFHGLGAAPPRYGHLPMIVNAQGKPYSKRDGDAYVGEFREKGYLPEALLNFLSLLGWSPGNDLEKMGRQELVQRFTLDRVKSSPAQMNLGKLDDLNARYMAELPPEQFIESMAAEGRDEPWMASVDPAYFRTVATLMQSRAKTLLAVHEWSCFFLDLPEYDAKAVSKNVCKEGIPEAMATAGELLLATDFSPAAIEAAIHAATERHGIGQGKLNQPLRVALTGTTVGAGVYETIAVLGPERTRHRLRHALDTLCRSEASG